VLVLFFIIYLRCLPPHWSVGNSVIKFVLSTQLETFTYAASSDLFKVNVLLSSTQSRRSLWGYWQMQMFVCLESPFVHPCPLFVVYMVEKHILNDDFWSFVLQHIVLN